MNVFQNKPTRALIFIMCALVVCGIIISKLYYKNINESADPRIVDARKLYENYNIFAQKNQIDSIFYLMDTIEGIYSAIDHYKNSFEVGVLYNNRAASFLTIVQNDSTAGQETVDSLVNCAEKAASKSIEIYDSWLEVYNDLSYEDIESKITVDFFKGLDQYDSEQKDNFLNNRIKEIQESQTETLRRLSVSYTNLGVIHRQNLQYEAAAKCYEKAIGLWDRNLTAENNLNILLGRPIKKRNFIQKLFPPERDQN